MNVYDRIAYKLIDSGAKKKDVLQFAYDNRDELVFSTLFKCTEYVIDNVKGVGEGNKDYHGRSIGRALFSDEPVDDVVDALVDE